MSAIQHSGLLLDNKLTIKSIFNKFTLLNYFLKKLTLWNQILSNDGQSINSKVPQSIRSNLNSSLNLINKMRQSHKSLDRVDWLHVGTATPDV